MVSQGIYFENVLIDKNITLTSYAIYDDLSEWVEWDESNEFYEVNNPHILNTIIDGGSITLANQFGSCIRVISPAGVCVQPTVFGLTLTNGKGSRGRIGSNDDSREEREVRVGGGLFVHKSSPKINYNRIIENKSEQDSVEGSRYSSGGGAYYYYSHNSQLENIDIIANNANYKGGALYYDYNQGIS